jgi:hypothetical protein
MGWSGHRMIDPTEIESRFAIEDGMSFMASVFTEPTDEALAQIETIRDIMESLPAREADFIDLYYFKRKKQTEIAHIFDCSQPTVCYRLQRATARIQFLLQLPHVEEEDLLLDMSAFLADGLDVQIMLLMWQTTCQSEVAKQLGVSQGLVRHRFLRSVKRMRMFCAMPELMGELEALQARYRATLLPSGKHTINIELKTVRDKIAATLKWVPKAIQDDPTRFGVYVRLFEFITANLNILREVQRPAWDARIVRKIDKAPS